MRNQLRLVPRFPPGWTTYKIHYRYRQTLYHITITLHADRAEGSSELSLDGQALTGGTSPLADDRIEHFVDERFADAIDWLSEGKKRHWKYENC